MTDHSTGNTLKIPITAKMNTKVLTLGANNNLEYYYTLVQVHHAHTCTRLKLYHVPDACRCHMLIRWYVHVVYCTQYKCMCVDL